MSEHAKAVEALRESPMAEFRSDLTNVLAAIAADVDRLNEAARTYADADATESELDKLDERVAKLEADEPSSPTDDPDLDKAWHDAYVPTNPNDEMPNPSPGLVETMKRAPRIFDSEQAFGPPSDVLTIMGGTWDESKWVRREHLDAAKQRIEELEAELSRAKEAMHGGCDYHTGNLETVNAGQHRRILELEAENATLQAENKVVKRLLPQPTETTDESEFERLARTDWVVFGKAKQLHALAECIGSPHCWDGGPAVEGQTACGKVRNLDIPGLFTRNGTPRCPKCCDATGMPHGIGSPKNDPDCRKILGLPVDSPSVLGPNSEEPPPGSVVLSVYGRPAQLGADGYWRSVHRNGVQIVTLTWRDFEFPLTLIYRGAEK